MSFLDYVVKGQIVDLEVELPGKSPKYMVRVEDISDSMLSVVMLEDDITLNNITKGTKGIIHGKKKGLAYSLYVEAKSRNDSSLIQLKHIPARTHLRVDAFILFKYKKITQAECQRRRLQFKQSLYEDNEGFLWASQHYIKEENEPQTIIPSDIRTGLHSINKKLDFIIKTLGKSEEENIFNNERREVNISGAGLKFKCSENFSPGDLLQIEMVLPIASGILIELIGEVVRCADCHRSADEQPECKNETAVKFAAVNEDDREFIIRYVFKRQRELLRAEENAQD